MPAKTLKRQESLPMPTTEKMPERASPDALAAADWSLEEEEIPEVFNLPPLSEKQITARIVQVERGQFYYGADEYTPEQEEAKTDGDGG